MGKPTISPKDKIAGGSSIIPSSIRSTNMGASSAGLTAMPRSTALRQVVMIPSAQIASAAITRRPIFLAGANLPKITYIGFCAGTGMYHAAAEADTWKFNIRNMTRGVSLNAKGASLSGITLAVTAFKSIPLNMGNSTMRNGEMLQIQLTISGTPQTLVAPMIVIHWVPTSNA